jgi:hypothetical protein
MKEVRKIPECSSVEYPDETFGSIAAREIRKECNRLTRQEREELFQAGMALIHGENGNWLQNPLNFLTRYSLWRVCASVISVWFSISVFIVDSLC